MSKPTAGDMMRLKRAVRCTLATKLGRLSLCPEPPPTSEGLPMVAPVDTDWASDRVDRKSTSSGQIYLCNALGSSSDRTEARVAQSNADAMQHAGA